MFSLNEKVVYPGHGVAKINRILEKNVAGNSISFFELTFLHKDMTILVPTHSAESVGLRPLSSVKSIREGFKILSEPAKNVIKDLACSNWNKRNKDYQCKLRTGGIKELCSIYRDLNIIAVQKELSYGEKNLLQQTENLLAQEISLVDEIGQEKAIESLRSVFKIKGSRDMASF